MKDNEAMHQEPEPFITELADLPMQPEQPEYGTENDEPRAEDPDAE